MKQFCIQMIDFRVTSTWWKRLVKHFIKPGDAFEIRCWKEEVAEITEATFYGETVEDKNEVSIKGKITSELLDLLLEEPLDKDIYNKMTRFFTVNLKNGACDFCSAHYGTEMYIGVVSNEDLTFCEQIMQEYGDSFSIHIYESL